MNHAYCALLAWGYSEVCVGLRAGCRRLPASSRHPHLAQFNLGQTGWQAATHTSGTIQFGPNRVPSLFRLARRTLNLGASRSLSRNLSELLGASRNLLGASRSLSRSLLEPLGASRNFSGGLCGGLLVDCGGLSVEKLLNHCSCTRLAWGYSEVCVGPKVL